VVINYFELAFRGSIETKNVKARKTADNPAYRNYLLNEVQCLGHENELRKLSHIYIYIYTYSKTANLIVGTFSSHRMVTMLASKLYTF